MGILANIYKWVIFKTGDTRWLGLKHFPFVVTWDVTKPEIKGEERRKAESIIKPGDVIILRHDGYASNAGIGGAMVHAAIAISSTTVVEALSDDEGGIVITDINDILMADKAMILRPQDLTQKEIDNAINWANQIRGFYYDIYFNFNSENERLEILTNFEQAKKGKVKFCCTEVPHFCYLDVKDKLRLYRKRNPKTLAKIMSWFGAPMGEDILTSDMYISANFNIVWASRGTTHTWFEEMGCDESIVAKVKNYWLTQ